MPGQIENLNVTLPDRFASKHFRARQQPAFGSTPNTPTARIYHQPKLATMQIKNMNTVTDYVVATGTDVKSLAAMVTAFIDQGYQPFGSLCTAYASDDERIYLYQSMVKFEKPN
jgi:hypothetical protein